MEVVNMKKEYFIGLDIGTNSVGYAITDPDYSLRKFRGEPMWGTHLFEEANPAMERRSFRTARRRLDRRQQRIHLLEELFAPEVCKIDPNFFIRRIESALYESDSRYGVKLFNGSGVTDKEYHKHYPTIHHLICDLMTSDEPHDVRLIYIACAWLVANRGHFLFDISPDKIENILDFTKVYQAFCEYLSEYGYSLPWPDTTAASDILKILQKDCGVRKKEEMFSHALYGGGKISKVGSEDFPFNRAAIITLLSGGKVKPVDLFLNDQYAEAEAVSLVMNDEDFVRVVAELDEDAELLHKLRAMKDCAQLISSMKNCDCISMGKVAVYEQHQKDLKFLKYFVKKYCPKKYDDIFRSATKDNYVSYSGNAKSLSDDERKTVKSATKDAFSDFLAKQVKNLSVSDADLPAYQDMLTRLQARTFLPKQKDSDNRVIPQQLYRYELQQILDHAQGYMPMLRSIDADGLTVKEKILYIFDFKIPYFVGPLYVTGKNNAWLVRKQEGKILPWNLEQMVDLDASEQNFIQRMTNRCTYLPDEDVLPANSLLYQKFMVLNEINNIKVNGIPIPVTVKQELYNELFCQYPRVTRKKIQDHLQSHGHMKKDEELSGVDITIKANLKSYHVFKRLLTSGVLTEDDVEGIICHASYSEDKSRMRRWLRKRYPQLPEDDVNYILRQKLKEFGRLSAKILNGLYGCVRNSDTGEAFTIIEALWETNDNFMQILSDKYTFAEQVKAICEESYAAHPRSLNDRLDEMYVSNAVKRPIFRTLDIVQDVVKANGGAPAKIFVEMARGGVPDQKGKRTKSRKEQILELYKQVKTDDSRRLLKELDDMGTMADNRLQSDRLFLYYLQLGKSAYTGKPLDITRLTDGTYNLEHIYPQCHVKDDSVLNNLVLVESEVNGSKSDTYPLPGEIRSKMTVFWQLLRSIGLMTDEKFRRLTRTTGFTPEEKMGFINRQLVETRQSTKVIKDLLQEMYPNTQIVCVKAGLVSEFRQEFDLLKCRSVNDLHHAKDAYLNVVVGNVYHERFTKRWFSLDSHYNIQVKKIFSQVQRHGEMCYWNGSADIALVKKMMGKNAVHLTRYSFCRKGGLFDQQPVKKGENLIPLKSGMDTEKYGGYNKPTASFYALARFTLKKKKEIMFVPISLLYADKFLHGPQEALEVTAEEIYRITQKRVDDLELLLNGRALKVNTVISLDGALTTLAGKSAGGRQLLISPLEAVILGGRWETYVKTIERFQAKQQVNKAIVLDAQRDHITKEKNGELYELLTEKMGTWPFAKLPNNQKNTLKNGAEKFATLDGAEQVSVLMNALSLFGAGAGGADLESIGGKKVSGSKLLSSNLSNWKKQYTDVRIVDQSASGLFESRSENLLEML